MCSPPSPTRSRTRGHRTATAPMPVMTSRSGRCPWRTSRRRPSSVNLSVWVRTQAATSASTACPNSVLAPLRKTSVSGSENVPGWVSWKTLVSVMAYHSFGGEVEALNTPTIRRLTLPCRHQLSALALTTRNGTASFVSFKGRQFAVTCRHVMESASGPDVVTGAPNPTVALHFDETVLNLSFFMATGLHVTLRAPDAERREQEVDVAIAELTGSYWGLLIGKKGKKAINLDNWREPNWPAGKMCVARGYPEEHKEIRTSADREKIAAPMLSITAEVAGPLGRDQRIITLSSRLDEPHGYYFSGISGGALYTSEV